MPLGALVTNGACLALGASIKLYDDIIDNGWQAHLSKRRADWVLPALQGLMVLTYVIAIVGSVEMHVTLGVTATVMFLGDQILFPRSAPSNLDDAFFYYFDIVVMAVFAAFVIVKPRVVLHAASKDFLLVLVVCMVAMTMETVLFPEEYSSSKAFARLCWSLIFIAAAVVALYVPRLAVLQPLFCAAIGYNVTWFLTHRKLIIDQSK